MDLPLVPPKLLFPTRPPYRGFVSLKHLRETSTRYCIPAPIVVYFTQYAN